MSSRGGGSELKAEKPGTATSFSGGHEKTGPFKTPRSVVAARISQALPGLDYPES